MQGRNGSKTIGMDLSEELHNLENLMDECVVWSEEAFEYANDNEDIMREFKKEAA